MGFLVSYLPSCAFGDHNDSLLVSLACVHGCSQSCPIHILSAVQDVAFQLERLVAGMYVYYRQCHKALKPAAIFPIEVELGFDPLQSVHDQSSGSNDAADESHDGGDGSRDEKEDKEPELNDDNQLDLLLPSVPLPSSSSQAPPTDTQESEIDRILAHDFEHEQ